MKIFSRILISISAIVFFLVITNFLSNSRIYAKEYKVKPKDFLYKKATITHDHLINPKIIVCDLDNDGKNEVVFTDNEEYLAVLKYSKGKLTESKGILRKCTISDVEVVELEKCKKYIIVLDYLNKKICVFEYRINQLIMKYEFKNQEIGILIKGKGDFDGDGCEEFIVDCNIFTLKNGQLKIFRKYPLQTDYLCGNFIGINRDQIASVIYKKVYKRQYRVVAFHKDKNTWILWREILPELGNTPLGNPYQTIFDFNGDGRDDIVQRLFLMINNKKTLAGRIIYDFRKSRHGYRPKIVIARSKKLKDFVEYAFICYFNTADIRGNGKKMGIRLVKKTKKKKKSEKYDIHNIVFCDFKNGKLIEYFCPGPSFTGKYDDLFSHQLIATGDIDNDGRDEIFVYIRKDEQQWIEVYGLNPKYY